MSGAGASGLQAHASRLADLDGSLAADFEGSLSGLGVEVGVEHYNMSEALLALPVFQLKSKPEEEEGDTAMLNLTGVYKPNTVEPPFQYILNTCTSPATKLNEETLTYLNQGQSYEIRLKCNDPSRVDPQAKVVKSVAKVCFHEKRLQYMEYEQLDTWRCLRHGERMLDIDIPLSCGISEVTMDPYKVNTIEFLWDASQTSASSVHVKVNCISTEFTPRKHGGEKGVPFRIQVETYSQDDNPHLLHCASCQIKVFKPKGADRKNKTDREKMEKRSASDRDKFQPSYECTVLSEIPIEQVLSAQEHQKQVMLNYCTVQQGGSTSSVVSDFTPPQTSKPVNAVLFSSSPNGSIVSIHSTPELTLDGQPLSPDTSSKDVQEWLRQNRFVSYGRIFQHFTGADLMKLTRDDLIQICGLADGIRLNNALTLKSVRPCLTLYVCQASETVYHAIYLHSPQVEELVVELCRLFGIQRAAISETWLQGPSDIHILATDQVIQNVHEDARFTIQAQSTGESSYRFILQPVPV